MIEVYPNLHVGSQMDEAALRAQGGWFVIHACKEPYHRQALGYSGRGAPKGHPEYLVARRPGRLILNLIDADNASYVPREIIDTALEAIAENIGSRGVLVHCNQGASRSPTIALLYLAKFTPTFSGQDLGDALAGFQKLYPPYAPARGMAEFVQQNWGDFVTEGAS